MKRFLKLFCIALVIFIPCYGLTAYINPYQLFRLDLDQHNIVSTERQETAHIVGYGIDVNIAEAMYLSLRQLFNASYINKKVYIYKAYPKWDSGQVGEDTFNHIKYYGAYQRNFITKQDTIIYNGENVVLLHELCHFFFNNMNNYHRDELFARMSEGFVLLINQQMEFTKLIQKLQLEIRKEAATSNV
jgi:hypothetical protein